MFWGIIFLLIGASFIFQTVFKIDLPIMRILFGGVLVYFGLKIIFNSFGLGIVGFNIEKIATETEAVFTNAKFKSRSANGTFNSKFSTAFGSSVLDLTDIKGEELEKEIRISNGFGKTRVHTNPETPIKAEVSSGFSSVKIRGQKIGAVGETDFQSPGWSPEKPYLRLKIEAGFGEVIIE